MDARVRVVTGASHQALVVLDEFTVSRERDGKVRVFVVNDQDVVEDRSITVGLLDHGWREVTLGLKADDRVVADSHHAEEWLGQKVQPRIITRLKQP